MPAGPYLPGGATASSDVAPRLARWRVDEHLASSPVAHSSFGMLGSRPRLQRITAKHEREALVQTGRSGFEACSVMRHEWFDAAWRRRFRRMLAITLGMALLGSTAATADHVHAQATEHPLSCAVCHAVHQPVQAGHVVVLLQPVPSPLAARQMAEPLTAPADRPFQYFFSRAPPA